MKERSTLRIKTAPTTTSTVALKPIAGPSPADPIPAEQPSRHELIAAEAYLLAAQRGFTPGHELDDWLAAETLVESRLRELSTGQRNR